MAQRIINLFDEYTHKPLRRDKFLSRLAKLTGGVVWRLIWLYFLYLKSITPTLKHYPPTTTGSSPNPLRFRALTRR